MKRFRSEGVGEDFYDQETIVEKLEERIVELEKSFSQRS